MVKTACLLLLFASFVTQISYGQEDSAGRRKAGGDISAHRYHEAMSELQPLLNRHPQDASLWTLRGMALGGLDRTAQSLASFDHAIAIDSRYVPALEGASQIAYLHGDPRAMHYLRLLLHSAPGNETANAMAGTVAYQAHKCGEAISYFDHGGGAVYSSVTALSEFADCLLSEGQAEKAESILLGGLQRHPENLQLTYNLAVIQLQDHQPAAVVARLAPFSRVHDAGLLNLLASAYVQTNRPDDAFRTLENAIRISPDLEANYLDLAILCLDHNEESKSVQAATAGIARIPKALSLYLIRGVAYAQLAQYDKAERDFTAAAGLEPDQPHSTIAMSLLYSDRQQVDKEKQLLRKQLRSTPHDAVTNYLYADLLIRLGAEPGQPAFEEAKQHVAVSLRSTPDSAEAQVLMGKILEQENDSAGALSHFDRALKVDPDNQAALNRELLVLRKLHRPEEAEKVIARLKFVLSKNLRQGSGSSQVRTGSPAKSSE